MSRNVRRLLLAAVIAVAAASLTSCSLTAVVQIAAGKAHTCALLDNGTVRCWGDNTAGQLGDGTTDQRTKATLVTGLSGVTTITAGEAHTCAVASAGAVHCWGANGSGQLGDGTTTQRNAPTPVSGLSGATAISAGMSHTCAVAGPAGTVHCWGANGSGQLGDGTTTQRNAPTPVPGLSAVTAITAHGMWFGSHTCARLSDGTARCWGANYAGQLGHPDTSVIQTPVPTLVAGVSGATAISTGGAHTCALLQDRTVRCWGLNAYGQLGNDTATDSYVPVQVTTA